MKRLFHLLLIALLQIQQFPCACQGGGVLRPCSQQCQGHPQSGAHPHACEDGESEAEDCHEGECTAHRHERTADLGLDCSSVNDSVPEEHCFPVAANDTNRNHSHPVPVCGHHQAARSLDRVRFPVEDALRNLISAAITVVLPEEIPERIDPYDGWQGDSPGYSAAEWRARHSCWLI